MNRLEMLLDLHRENPVDTFTLFAIAKEYEKGGKMEFALEYYLKLQTTDANYVGLYYHLGKLYEHLQLPDKAIEIYRLGLKVAAAVNDKHAYNELNGARLQIDDDDL